MAETSARPAQQEGAPEQEAAFSTLPVLRGERTWGFGDFTWVNVGLAIATWAFLIGGSTALFVGAKAGIAAIIIGNVISVPLMALATCVPSAKYGLEQYTSLRSVFGKNGTRLIVFGFVALIEMGWAAVLAIMFGRATSNVANAAFGTNAVPNGAFVVGMALLAIAISWLALVKGPVSIKWLNRIIAPGLAIVTLVMLVLIFSERSWGELVQVPEDLRIFHGDGMEPGEYLLAGGSAIVGPDGNYLAGPAGTEEVILYADLDTGRIAAEHQTCDSVGHYARPDVFDLTVNTAPRGHPEAR